MNYLSDFDPLGAAYEASLTPDERRARGVVYTPQHVVRAMIHLAAAGLAPSQVVDPGCGSGRFSIAAAQCWPDAQIIAVDTDPQALGILRQRAKEQGVADRIITILDDFRTAELPATSGKRLFIGNPPYTRHHVVGEEGKTWLTAAARSLNVKPKLLSGLHAHFIARTAQLAHQGDEVIYILPAEWMVTGYGSMLRQLLLDRLGLRSVHIADPETEVFPGVLSSAAVVRCEAGFSTDSIMIGEITPDLHLSGAEPRPASELDPLKPWRIEAAADPGHVRLGDYIRVSRGASTGDNKTYIVGPDTPKLPETLLRPAVTQARELSAMGDELKDPSTLRRVVVIPPSLSELSDAEREAALRFISWAEERGAKETYTARTRKAWWSVALPATAPILMTYMGRKPPKFVLNKAGVMSLNIAHGLYPKRAMTDAALARLVAWLNGNIGVGSGRIYAGGLAKFEPGEIEALSIPRELIEDEHESADTMDQEPTRG